MKIAFRLAGIVAALVLVAGCAGRLSAPDPAWVQAITQGEISRSSTVRVMFTRPLGQNLEPAGILRLSPSVEGRAYWQDDFTLAFEPADRLAAATRYTARVSLPEIDGETPPAFGFRFVTPELSVSARTLTLEFEDPSTPNQAVLRGELVFSDTINPEELPDLLAAEFDGADLEVQWDSSGPAKSAVFSVKGLRRGASAQAVSFSFKNRNIRVSDDVPTEVLIPAIGDFSVQDVRPRDFGGTVMEVVFSQPLDPEQDFRGLVRVVPEGSDGVDYSEGLAFAVRNNLLRVFSNQQWPSSFSVEVNPGIRDRDSAVLAQFSATTVRLPQERPEVRFVGAGTIVPSADSAYIPIETRNLRALMVQAIRIPSASLHQFAQLNTLTQTQELERVGYVAWQKEVELPWRSTYSDQYIRHGLDISDLVAEHDPGLYHIRLTFRRPHIVFDTPRDFSDEEVVFPSWPTGPGQTSDASSWDWYTSYQNRQYRFDPTHDAFYQAWSDHNITKGKNIFVSTLGLMAQIDDGNFLQVQALDLRTAEPARGAQVEVLNYQQASILSGTIDTNGSYRAQLPAEFPPFLVRVTRGEDVSYLRLQQQDALNISHFDVGGERDEVSVQGVIYGERDVWRPGDTIHLTFVLRDRFNTIPQDHPVSLALYDPQGNQVYRQTKSSGVQGMYYFPASTRSDATTGVYRALVDVGSHQFERQIRVETVIPNRLKIELSLESQNGLIVRPQLTGTIRSTWLHGAVAGGLDASIEANVSPAETSFSRYSGFVFDDPSRQGTASQSLIFDGQLDSQGVASFDSPIRVNNAPGMMNATLVSRVYEPSGVFSTEYYTQKFSPYEGYVGMRVPPGDAARGMLLTDTPHRVELALVDSQGNPRSGRVRMELYKLNWAWWWETDPQNNPNFYTQQSSTPITSENVSVSGGTGQYSFQINFPQWGRYILYATDLDTGHRSAKIMYIDWPGWAGRAMDGPGDAPAVLTFTSDKSSYQVGETATLNLPLGTGGRALVIVEANGRIVRSDWVVPRGSETQYRFPVTAEMLPNVYAHVSYVQPYGTANDRPLRALGVIPLQVRDTRTELQPVITTADIYAPGETAEIRIRESQGRPMAYTLAIVDEGLLGLTRYQTPNLWSSFYRRTASLLKSYDLYNLVAGAATGDLASLLGIGGSDEGAGASDEPQSRWEPVVIFLEPQQLAAREERVHRIEIPEYLGAVRVMAVAVDQSGPAAFGKAEKEVIVRRPLMALGTLPRVLSPGDEISLPLSVFALENNVNQVTAIVEAEGLVSIEGSRFQSIQFPQPGEKTVVFSGRVANAAGSAVVSFTVRSGTLSWTHRIPVEVRMPTVPETRSAAYSVAPGRSITVPVEVFGLAGTNDVTVELTNFQPIDLDRRLGYLVHYPYGCLEQTTSSVFPQLYVESVTNLSAAKKAEVSQNIRAGIERIQTFQISNGGFSFWPGSGTASDWATSYAGHFLLEARRAGYFVPTNLLDNWLNYQRASANSANPTTDAAYLTQAYRLYTLALAGQPEMGAMNRLAQSRGLSVLAKWRLAAAFDLAGNRSQAQNLVAGILSPNYSFNGQSSIYGSLYREQAMYTESLLQLGRTTEAGDLVNSLSGVLSSSASLSTQTTAYMLMAVAKYAESQGVGSEVAATLSWRGGNQSVQGGTRIVSRELDTEGLADQPVSLVVQNQGRATTTVRVLTRGNPPRQTETPISDGYSLRVSYTKEGFPYSLGTPLRSGEQIKARVTVTNTYTGQLDNTALSYLVPTGWEIVNSRLAETARNTRLVYQDIRDDRVYSFFDLPRSASMTIEIDMVATYAGRFYHPPVLVEAMYEPRYMARSGGSWVEVNR